MLLRKKESVPSRATACGVCTLPHILQAFLPHPTVRAWVMACVPRPWRTEWTGVSAPVTGGRPVRGAPELRGEALTTSNLEPE